jgi:hypothetical protein
MRPAGIGALVLLGLTTGHGVAQAQFGNPYMGNQQYLFNLQAGRAALANSMASANPAFAMPFPTPAYNPYLAYGANPYLGTNPYTPLTAGSNPYTPMSSAYDPYTYGGGYGGYSPYSSLWSNPAIGPGFALMGQADVMRAYGTVITSQEQARLMREQWYQTKLKTAKDAFDLQMYIRANTPTFTEEQLKVAKHTLARIQKMASPTEIVEGRSLNFLLGDVDKNRGKATVTDIPLTPDVLRHLNIKPAGIGSYSLGMLRDPDKLSMPSALVDLLPADARQELESRAKALAQNAIQGKEPDRNALKDLRIQIEQTMDKLVKKANDFGTPEYMAAKRFLNDLESARRAIDSGDAKVQVEYQKAASKISNVNELIALMIDRGWQFAPSTQADEAAYRALHSALVAYDVALNQQVAQAEGQ